MFKFVLSATLLVAANSASAQEGTNALRSGAGLRDSNGTLLGVIDRVRPDGSVRLVFKDRIVTIPAASISIADGRAVTKLTRAEVTRLK